MKKLLAKIKKLFGSSQKGFTLIELLVVIAILGVLAVGVLVAVNPAARINSAKDTTSQNNMSTEISALETYLTDNSSYPQTTNVSADLTTNGTYLKILPKDSSGTSFVYTAQTSGGAACTDAAGNCAKYSISFQQASNSANLTCYKSATTTFSTLATCTP